jgi:L-ascorbate metabolism protein UlaG (beta-lactamase superfamily)
VRSADAAGRREPGLLPRPIPADAVRFENGFKLYHMGDTGLFGDMRLIGDYYKPDLIRSPSAATS